MRRGRPQRPVLAHSHTDLEHPHDARTDLDPLLEWPPDARPVGRPLLGRRPQAQRIARQLDAGLHAGDQGRRLLTQRTAQRLDGDRRFGRGARAEGGVPSGREGTGFRGQAPRRGRPGGDPADLRKHARLERLEVAARELQYSAEARVGSDVQPGAREQARKPRSAVDDARYNST